MNIKQYFIVLITLCASFMGFGQASDLIISEYGEGSSNNKYIEIYNGTGANVDLSNYEIWKVSNGGIWPEFVISLTGTLIDGDVFIISNPSSNATILAVADLTTAIVDWNGDDAVGLAKNILGIFTLIDAVGADGSDPGTGWSVAGITNATVDHTLLRKNTICDPNTNWISSAGTNVTDSEWVVLANDIWSDIGSHTGNCFASTDTIDWCNLQFPEVGNITTGGIYDVYARVYEPGITPGIGQDANITVWIGYNTSDTNPNTWSDSNWVQAGYNSTCADGCNGGQDDEYFIDIGPYVTNPGKYYYASRVQYNGGPYRYGGYSPAPGGGFWDGSSYVSGILTVNPLNCSELFMSEYVEGSSNNKFLEIYNPNSTSVTLSGIYSIEIYSNGSSSVTTTINLVGTITANSVFIVENSGETLGVISNQSVGGLNFTGNDAVALVKSGTIIDVIGQIGVDPGNEWTGTFCAQGTENGTLIRNSVVQVGDFDGYNAFNPDAEWACFGQDNISDIGFHTSSCVSTNELQLQEPIGTDIACGYTYNFGSQNINTNTDFTFRIKNIGTTDLTINSLSFVNGTEYSLVNPPTTPFIISGGAYQDIVIRYRPLSIGLHLDTLTINNDDSSENNCSINFEGIGSTDCATTTQIINQQDFESSVSDTWNYTANHTAISDYWYVTNSLINIPAAQSNSNFWGITDLDRSGHRNKDYTHEIIFDAVNISSYTNVQLSFYYFTINVDNSDDFEYELFYDSISQGRIDISANTNGWNQVIVNIPDTVNSVQIIFYANLDAGNDNAGLDNFTLTSTTINTSTWTSSGWDTPPGIDRVAIINSNFNTTTNGSFSACNLIVNDFDSLSNPIKLTISDNTYVEVQNNLVINGEILVENKGSLVQNDDGGTFNLVGAGTSSVHKLTALKQQWYYYTYWSSPVEEETVDGAFPDAPTNRRFLFEASNYFDSDDDGIDDNGNDWQIVAGTETLTPGVGYAVTGNPFAIGFPYIENADFVGPFNTSDITTSIYYDSASYKSWNLIGNPYPCALDFDVFYTINSSIIEGAAYFWSQASPPLASNPGNQVLNFSQNDYAIYTVGVGGTKGGGPDFPTQYVPSAQGFFINSKASGNVTFKNSMRDTGNNTQFFRQSGKTKSLEKTNSNKIWIDLTSDNGVFSQILVGYVNGATNDYDGMVYDAPRNASVDYFSIIYTTIEGDNEKFAIQGKEPNILDINEVIKLGFETRINVATLYKLSIAQIEGDFLTSNTIYLKDNLLNKVHDLTASDYSFTSDVGEFKDRFEIVFQSESLSDVEAKMNLNKLTIIELNDGRVQLKTNSIHTIKSVQILDLLGRTLYQFKGTNTTEIYNLNNLSQSAYIAKVELSNGQIITKKAIKRN